MGARRTLLRQQDQQFVSKPHRIGPGVTEKRGVPGRRSTPELRGTKSALERIGVPKCVTRSMVDDELYDVCLHFTKGWRRHPVRAKA